MTAWILRACTLATIAVMVSAATGLLLALALPASPGAEAAWVVVALTAAITLTGLPRPRFAMWRVPRRAYFFGHREGVGVVFGGALGAMFLTELPSYGAVALAVWALLVAQPLTAAAVFASFGLARALPVITEGVASYQRRQFPAVYSCWYRLSRYLALPEAVLLGSLALHLHP